MAKKAQAGPALGPVELAVWACRCRCGHLWFPREWLNAAAAAGGLSPHPDAMERPRVCPECKSPNWDRPKLYERKPAS